MPTIAIIGASKGIGLAAVEEALGRGHKVRAFARSAGRIALDDPNLELCPGDALRTEDVARAVLGADAVILALGLAPGPGLVFGPVRLFSAATRILIPEMQRAGVARLICVTGFGAGDSRTRIGPLQAIGFHLLLGRAYADKDIQEALIETSPLDWVIARPGILTNGRKTGRYQVLTEPDSWRNGFISRADVADFLLNQVTDQAYLRRKPVLVY